MPIEERRLPNGKLIGYIDTTVFPFILYDKEMNVIGKQISIEDASESL